MYQPFHKLRVRFAELEMKQGEVAKRANMAESTLTARMTGRLPWNGDEIARVAKVVGIPTDQIGTFFFERNERPLTPICPASFGSMHERSFAVIGRSFAAACRRQKRFSY